jgi:putative heme-binding domain-containing protein
LRFDRLNAQGLAAAIDSPNGPQRDLAHQMLVERQSRRAVEPLREIARKSRWPAARVQALCALGSLNGAGPEFLQQTLADACPSVRRHAVRLAEPLLGSSPHLVKVLAGLVSDDDPQVKLQLAYTLGAVRGEGAASSLATLALASQGDVYLLSGVWSSVNQSNVAPVVRSLLAEKGRERLPQVFDVAFDLLIKLGNPSDIQTAAHEIASSDVIDEQVKLEAASRLLSWATAADDQAGVIVEQLSPIVDQALAILARDDAAEAETLAAIRVIAASGPADAGRAELLIALIGPRHSPAVQQAAVRALMATGDPESAAAVLAAWRSFGPDTRRLVFDLAMGSNEAAGLLLEGIAGGEFAGSDFDALQRQRLLAHSTESIRRQARQLLAGDANNDRAGIIATYRESVTGGDGSRGREVFAKHCSSCHQLDGVGHSVGPDLAALTNRNADSLLTSILDPNRDIDERYRSYTAVTAEGLAHAGILVDENSTSVTLVEQQGARRTLLRSDLEALENTGKSLMPEGLERDLSAADVANLVAYLSVAGLQAKQVEGNSPVEVVPDPDGSLWLLASNCEIYGESITFEQPLQNIGYWGSQGDHVAWNVRADEAREYEVFVHWASSDDTAGGSFVIEGGDPVLVGKASSTGGYHRYRTQRLGTTSLPAGERRVSLRPAGPLSTGALMDLRGVYLVPVGVSTERAEQGDPPTRSSDASDEIAAIVEGLSVGTPAEYDRIPEIWEAAISAGRRNHAAELLRLLELATPKLDEPLHDWQAVVLGGGIVNGLTHAGAWPRQRLESILLHAPELRVRFERSLKLAAAMADDPRTSGGTRYDALRLLGVDSWQNSGQQLLSYLTADVDHELQMGAVSALLDMEAAEPAAAVIESFGGLTDSNKQLAIEGLMRSAERRRLLADAIESGKIPADAVADEQRSQLTNR